MASLLLGAFNLIQTDGSARVMAEGTSWGEPVPIEVAINSFLQDGSVVVTQGYDNRTVAIRVRFSGTDLAALNAKEAALFAELGEPNLLTWSPGGSAPSMVFVVVTSALAQEDESFVGEVQDKPWRTYNIRLTCEATTRSAATFASVALPASGTTTTNLDACAATTGWTATINGVAATVVNAAGPPTVNTVTQAAALGTFLFSTSKTFAATTSSLKFLTIDWKPSPASTSTLTAYGDGTALPLIAEQASPTSGFTRTTFYVAAASLALLRLDWSTTWISSAKTRIFTLDNVAITDARPGSGTNRQQIQSLTVPGSARTPGSLAIESASAALGDTLVYAYPADTTTTGYSPPLRQFRASGNAVTPDAAQVSGNTEPINGGSVVFDVPIGLFPRGSYLLLGRMATSGGGAPLISIDSWTVLNSVTLGAFSATRTITTTTAYQIFTLGRIQLPTVDIDPSAATAGVVMRLRIGASTTCTYDEFWLFNTTIGRLIQVSCGTGAGTVGGSARRLFIEPPTTTTPRPTVRIGHSADRSDSFYPQTFSAWGFPEFKPPQVNVLAVTSNATDASITLSGYAHWHTNPGS